MQINVLKQRGEEAYLATPLLIKLQGKGALHLDLVAFYKTKKGESGGIYPENYSKNSLGNLDQFPFMQLNQENNGKTLRIVKINEMEVIYFCVLNFKDIAVKKKTTFGADEVFIEILDDKGESFITPVITNESSEIAIIAKIDNTHFMGTRLINENLVISLKQLLDGFPGTRNFIKAIVEHRSHQNNTQSSPNLDVPEKSKYSEEVTVKSGYHFAHQATLPIKNDIALLQRWFKQKNIQFNLNEEKIDISGFFDEIAIELGDNYGLLSDLHGKIKWCQRKKFSKLNFDLAKYSQQEIGKIKNFCQNLLKAAFLTKYYAEKGTKKIHLTLQDLPKVVNFFNGDWLEWYVFMKVTSFLYERKQHFAYCRGGNLVFQNGDKHEIDLFFLIDNKIPLLIECKSGEFRSSLGKYTILRQRLSINKANTLLFVMGLSNEESHGLTAMFDVNVVNEHNFLTYVAHCSVEDKK